MQHGFDKPKSATDEAPDGVGTAFFVTKGGEESLGETTIQWWFDSGGWAYSVRCGEKSANSWEIEHLVFFTFGLKMKPRETVRPTK